RLVAAAGQAGAVVALDPDLHPQRLAQPRRRLQRRRQMRQPNTGKSGEMHEGESSGGMELSLAAHPGECRDPDRIAGDLPVWQMRMATKALAHFHLGPGIRRDERFMKAIAPLNPRRPAPSRRNAPPHPAPAPWALPPP